MRSETSSAGRPRGRTSRRAAGSAPSKSLLWQTFGSLTNALREAGFDIPSTEDRAERALAQGELLARRLGRLPRFADWAEARREDAQMLTEWQVYRLFERGRGAWSSFQYLLRERLVASGARVDADGKVY